MREIPEWSQQSTDDEAFGDGVRKTVDGFVLGLGPDRWPMLDYRWANHLDEEVRRVASNRLRARERLA